MDDHCIFAVSYVVLEGLNPNMVTMQSLPVLVGDDPCELRQRSSPGVP